MTTLMREALEEELGWLICEAAQGGGKGKCDPSNCVCHGEAERLIAVFRKHGLTLSALSSPAPDRLSGEERRAVENLRTHQEQCDMDGVMVKVSRQAVDETLAIIDHLSRQPEAEPVAWQWKHHDPISGNVVWREQQFWNGHRSTEQRALYTSPRLDREKVARIAAEIVEKLNCDWGFNKNPTRDEATAVIADAIMREAL